MVRELEESTGTLYEDRDKHLSKHLEKFWKDSKEVQRRLSKKAPLVPDTSRVSYSTSLFPGADLGTHV